jgi:hypothetical protein
MTTTSTAFPLATEDPYTGGQDPSAGSANSGSSIDDAAGASGSTTGAVELSHGALVAIIIVVVVVALGGSKTNLILLLMQGSNNCPSRLCGFVLLGQEEGMEGQGDYTPLSQKSCNSTDAASVRVPKISQRVWKDLTRSRETG